MDEKRDVVNLGIQIDAKLRDELGECAKREKRTMRAVVELALEKYFKESLEKDSKGGL